MTDNRCRYCERPIVKSAEGIWIDPEASGDDSVWRETCDAHDTMTADHEPIHRGHWSLFGTYWCDTCNSPYCELA